MYQLDALWAKLEKPRNYDLCEAQKYFAAVLHKHYEVTINNVVFTDNVTTKYCEVCFTMDGISWYVHRRENIDVPDTKLLSTLAEHINAGMVIRHCYFNNPTREEIEVRDRVRKWFSPHQ